MTDAAARCRRYLRNYGVGSLMDAESLERLDRGLDALCEKYGTDCVPIALERHFLTLEEAGLKVMRRRA